MDQSFLSRTVFGVIICYCTVPAALADIVQPIGGSSDTPSTQFAQSFTATASEAQIGTVSFMWGGALNPSAPDPAMYVQLRSGAGVSTTLLAQKNLSPTPDSTPPNTWIDFTFDAPIALTAGQTYTLLFAANNTALVSGSYLYSTSDPYAGGSRYLFNGTPIPQNDLVFRVLAVPEPGFMGMAVISVAALFARRRR
jgi:hypothetical protein